MIVVESERLVLRRLSPEDAPFVLELLNDPGFLRHVGDRGVRTLEQARAYVIEGPMASYDAHGFGLYLVTTKGDGTPIGLCGLLKRDTLDDVDVGYALLPAFRAQGYAYEAASAVLSHAREALGLTRIAAIVQAENADSIRVLERLGLGFERTLRLGAEGTEVLVYARAM